MERTKSFLHRILIYVLLCTWKKKITILKSLACPLSWWCHPTISSSVIHLSSCLQSLPESGSFQMSQFFTSECQSIDISASASALPMNIQDWLNIRVAIRYRWISDIHWLNIMCGSNITPLGWTDWISLQSNRLSRVFSNTTVQKHQFFLAQLSL